MKKGFTLIELLAVIVILAIIALIATPMILGVIESSKKGAAESSVQGYIKGIEQYYVTSQLTGIEHYPTNIRDLNGVVAVKGEKPSRGYVTLDDQHAIIYGEFCMNGYFVAYDGKNAKVDTSKKCEDISEEIPLTAESCFEVRDGIIRRYYDNEDSVSSNPACPKKVNIPSTIGGVTVTRIDSGAFSGKQLTHVILPPTLTIIDSAAFYENQLTSIIIPDGVVTIDKNAFSSNQLTSVVIPSSVMEVVSEAFSPNQLTSVKIKGKRSASDFTIYGPDPWGWKSGYSDANIEWNA